MTPRPRHEKNLPEIMDAWQEELPAVLKKLQNQFPDKNVQIYFSDEARFGQKGYLTRGWYRTGSRPTVIKQNRFTSGYLTAAANPITGEFFSIVTSCMDTAVIQIFLNEFRKKIKKDEIVLLILDQASWHKTKTLQVPHNIVLHYLPPYSPELNPIENLWQYVKSHFLSGRVYQNLEAILEAGCSAMNELTRKIVSAS